MTDMQVENHGSIFLLRGISEAGKDWINEHLPMDVDTTTTWFQAVVVEHRFIEAIVMGAIADGLTVQ